MTTPRNAALDSQNLIITKKNLASTPKTKTQRGVKSAL